MKRFFEQILSLACVLLGGYGMVSREVVQVPVNVTAPKQSTRQMIHNFSEMYRVPEDYVWAIRRQESSDGKRIYRFEPGKMDEALRVTKDEQEARMLASSHCEMHILGLTARRRGVYWADLYDQSVCLETAIHELALLKQDAIKRAKKQGINLTEPEAWRRAIAAYNGSEAYVALVMARLGEIEMEKKSGTFVF